MDVNKAFISLPQLAAFLFQIVIPKYSNFTNYKHLHAIGKNGDSVLI